MRPQPDRRYYVNDAGAVMHCRADRAPPGALEIDEDEAARIKALRPKPSAPTTTSQPTTSVKAPQAASAQPPDTSGRLALAVAMAGYAIQAGVQAGDYRWHGGDTDFEWQGVRYDAPGLIEHARSVLG